jgi:hypothetical protein
MAPLGLSIGVGYRIRRLIIRPTAAWRRRVHGASVIGVGVLLILLAFLG